MDDLSERLSGILNDPESLNKIKEMAAGLFAEQSKENKDINEGLSALGDIPDAEEMRKIMTIVSRLKSKSDDSRTRLLEALKPNLSEQRRKRVDFAIKMLKLIDMLPLLKESGIFNA